MRVKLIVLGKMVGLESRDEFAKAWVEHAERVTSNFERLSEYRVCITREDSLRKMFDGLAELVWESVEEMNEDLNSELGVAAAKDAQRFMTEDDLLLDEYIIELKGK